MSWGIFARLGAVVAVGLVLAGCDSIQGAQQSVTKPGEAVNASQNATPTAEIVAEYFKRAPKATDERMDYRNKIITYRLIAIDEQYKVFVKELREARVGSGLAADISALLANFAGIITGGAATKTILHGASAVIIGSKGALDKNAFYDKALDALIAQMDAQRSSVSADIFLGMKKSSEEYSLVAAIYDLDRLDQAASIDRAIASITQTAKDEATKQAAITTAAISSQEVRGNVQTSANKLLLSKDKADQDKLVAIVSDQHTTLPAPRRLEMEEMASRIISRRGGSKKDPATAALILDAWIGGATDPIEQKYWQDKLK